MTNHKVKCSNFNIANDQPFTLIAGPCQLENEAHAIKISTELKKITSELGINFIYKTSFDKANRTSLKGKRGIGLEKSLAIFDKIKKEVGVPVLTDKLDLIGWLRSELTVDELADLKALNPVLPF